MESEGAAAIPQLVESLNQAPTAQAPPAPPPGQRGSNSNVHSTTHSHKESSYSYLQMSNAAVPSTTARQYAAKGNMRKVRRVVWPQVRARALGCSITGPSSEKIRKDLFTDTFCKVCGAVLLYESQRISHYEGKKHAQKVQVYFQMHSEQELEEVADKKQKVESMNFQMDGNEVSDKNKFCSLCNMVFSSAIVAQSHYVGKIHAKKLKQANGEHALTWPPVVSSIPPTNVEKETGTSVPAEASDSSDQPKQDVKIDLHSLSEINTEDPDKYCKLCCAQFNNPLMAQQHYIGKRHGRNRHRKRMMEEMEDEGVISDSSTSAVGIGVGVGAGAGAGTYVCPVCSLTFLSIEMYQSHMQGTKHHIKENIVVHVLKSTKKSYDSFQDELADYIKVQKARGLEPKTNIRKTEDCNDSDDYEEGKDERAQPGGFVPERIPAFDRPRGYPQNCSRPPRSRLPYRTHVQRNYFRGRLIQHGPLRPKYYPEQESKLPAPFKLDVRCTKRVSPVQHTSSDDSSDSYHRERRHKKKRRKEKRHRESEDFKKHHRHAPKKRRKSSDNTESEMEDSNIKHKEEAVEESTHADNVKHEEEKKCKDELSAEKDIKKHKRAKKKKDIDPRTEEEKLWDESILGF